MKQVTIRCTGLTEPWQLHREFARALEFPQWYGGNLDALHDCLMQLGEDTQLILVDFYGLPFSTRGFARVLEDSMEENPRLDILLTKET